MGCFRLLLLSVIFRSYFLEFIFSVLKMINEIRCIRGYRLMHKTANNVWNEEIEWEKFQEHRINLQVSGLVKS